MRDPFIAEIRKIRGKMYKEYERDPVAFRARIKAIEEKHRDRLVRLKPRRLSKVPRNLERQSGPIIESLEEPG